MKLEVYLHNQTEPEIVTVDGYDPIAIAKIINGEDLNEHGNQKQVIVLGGSIYSAITIRKIKIVE